MKHALMILLATALVACGQVQYAFTNFAGMPGVPGSANGTGGTAQFNEPNGVAVDGAGNVYVADMGNHTIRKIMPDGAVTTLAGSAGQPGSTDGIGSAARFNAPISVAVDRAGNLYIGDAKNHRITKGTPATTLPALKVTRSGDALLITWPAWLSGAVLETTDALTSTASWVPVSAAPATIGDQTVVTVDIEGGMKFYRLRKP